MRTYIDAKPFCSGFRYEEIDNDIVVYDHFGCDMSTILTILKSQIKDLVYKGIIYRHPHGGYHGIRLNHDGSFLGYPFNEPVLDRALTRLHQLKNHSIQAVLVK